MNARFDVMCGERLSLALLMLLGFVQSARAQPSAREIFVPEHPAYALEVEAGMALAPPATVFFADVHGELRAPVAIGFRGAFVRCDGCSEREGEGELDYDPMASAAVYATYSRENYAIGASLNFVLGDQLDSGRQTTAFGGGLVLRLGRFDGVRFDLALSGVARGELGGFGFYSGLRVPVYANELVRIWLECRSELVIPSPTVLIVKGGVRARIGWALLGVHGVWAGIRASLVASLGVRVGE